MSAAIVVSGYLAGVALRGAADEDGIETQSKVEAGDDRAAVHAAITIDALVPHDPSAPFDGFRDVDVGGRLDATIGVPLRLLADAHALDDGLGHSGGAFYGELQARPGPWEGDLGVGVLGFGTSDATPDFGAELYMRAARRGLGGWLDAGATAIVTGDPGREPLMLSAGADLIAHPSQRWSIVLEGLDGSRQRTLLSHGQWVESVSNTQHGWLRATAAVDLGRFGTAFAAASLREDTTPDGHDTLVEVLFAGASTPL